MPLIIDIPLLFSLLSSVHSLCSAELVDAEVTSENPCLDPVKQYQYPVAGADLHARVTNESVSSVRATQRCWIRALQACQLHAKDHAFSVHNMMHTQEHFLSHLLCDVDRSPEQE